MNGQRRRFFVGKVEGLLSIREGEEVGSFSVSYFLFLSFLFFYFLPRILFSYAARIHPSELRKSCKVEIPMVGGGVCRSKRFVIYAHGREGKIYDKSISGNVTVLYI